MSGRIRCLLVLISLAAMAAAWSFAADPKTVGPDKPHPSVKEADALVMAARIDQFFAKRWADEKVVPAPIADDAEFLRRVYLDLAGKIPSVSEAQTFLDDRSPDKRRLLIDRLLESRHYVSHFADVWKTAWLPPGGDDNFRFRFSEPQFEAWLRKRLQDNTGYDKMVRQILTPASGRQENPFDVFLVANEQKVENLAGSTARMFLGVKIECAQCHDHRFAHWKKEQFWEYAAFFANASLGAADGPEGIFQRVLSRQGLLIPGTAQRVQARYLDEKAPEWKGGVSATTTLAEWMTAKDNPYFARAAVNRVWSLFFGVGLVEPMDDVNTDPANQPELLDALAKDFVAHDYDLKYLIRAFVNSRVYQLTSAGPALKVDQPNVFARMAVKGMSGEQLFDSLAEATGFQNPVLANPRMDFRQDQNTPRGQFLAKFNRRGEKTTEAQTTILQAVALMNGSLVSDAVHWEKSETLAAVANATFLEPREQIETLYLATLSRRPRPEEAKRLTEYVAKGDAKKNLADVFWALLNSGEFMMNH